MEKDKKKTGPQKIAWARRFNFLIFLFLPGLVAAHDNDYSTSKKAVWTATLDSERTERGCEWSPTMTNGDLAFIDSQKIAVGVHLQCFQPFRIFVVVLLMDARSGKIMKRTEWNDASLGHSGIWIAPTHDGRFLVNVG